ncbi:MAG: hypothetical protein KGL39_17600 [Patescibacteria group bacterium]|nr:hypothetical protein [Patescibacteria group bacterium]
MLGLQDVLRAHGIGGAGGDATQDEVLSGATFVGANGPQTGTMPNLSATTTLQPGASLGPGYINTISGASPGTGSQTWSTPGTYTFTVPSGVTRILALLWGAGGGGAGAGTTGGGGAGGGGAFGGWFLDVTPGESVSITVGQGGSGGASGANGAAGGASSITVAGTTYTANGGGAGGVWNSTPYPTASGGAAPAVTAGATLFAFAGGAAPNQSGGGGAGAGGPGGTATGVFVSAPGGEGVGNTSTWAGGAGGANLNQSGNPAQPGVAPGGGGAGADSVSTPGAAGANGLVVVYW